MSMKGTGQNYIHVHDQKEVNSLHVNENTSSNGKWK